MAVLHYGRREIRAKVAYFGPAGAGKAANLRALHDALPMDRRGAVVEASPDAERSLRYWRLPILGEPETGWAVRFEAATIPGHAVFSSTRRNLLSDIDGVVFVADASAARQEANRAAWLELRGHLVAFGYKPEAMPLVLQVNHADVHDAVPLEVVVACLEDVRPPAVLAVAKDGPGVVETWRAIESLVRLGWTR
ncbi:MAG: hypothetical protein VKO21_07930 [Candidatus Sericytochromatia bacterium]|nr:hypothetical protein [Candidatus Sericytochromatia bacterium]